jgi:superoxide dismutase
MNSDAHQLEARITSIHRRDTLLHMPDSGCWHFFLDHQERLACRFAKTAGGEWIKEELLAAVKAEFWHTVQDHRGKIHGVFNDTDGLLWHLQEKDSAWIKTAIAAPCASHRKPLYLQNHRSGLELIAAELGNIKDPVCLRLYRFEQEQWADLGLLPVSSLINSISELEQWQIRMDSKNLVHCLFPAAESGTVSLFHQECLPFRRDKIKSIRLSANWRPDMGSALAINQHDLLHILWVDGKTNELKHRRKLPGGWPSGGWQPEQCLASWSMENLPPILMVQGDLLLAAWQQGSKIHGCLSHNQGVTWDSPASFPEMGEPVVLRYISEDAKGEQYSSFALGDLPGSILSPALFLAPPEFLFGGLPQEAKEPAQPFLPDETSFPAIKGAKQEKAAPDIKAIETGKESNLSFFIQQHNDYFQRLTKQVEELRLANQQLEQEISDKNMELIAANSLARQQEARAKLLVQQTYNQGEHYKMMESSLKQLKAENTQITSQIQKNTTLIESYKEELKLAREELRGASFQLKEKDGEILHLKQRLQAKEQETMEALRQLTDKTRQLQESDKRLKETENILQEAQRKISERKPGILERIVRSIQ